jgi:predicted nucleotidyltransferase
MNVGEVARSGGAAGVIVRSPADPNQSYRVRFPDGFEASFSRHELTVLSQFQAGDLAGDEIAAADEFYQNVIYRCIMGSKAYGLDDDASDTDRRGIYLPSAERQWSLYGVPEQLENDATQEVYWELQKFLTLALRANPNVLECLYTPLVEHASPIADRLLAIRGCFLSKLVYQTYNGYVMSQFKKLQADLRQHGQAKPKHLMHLIRLLLAGIKTLQEGVVPVHVGEHRDQLFAIKRGEVGFENVDAWRKQLQRQFDSAFESTRLPDRPDCAAVNALLIEARRSMV